MKQLGGSIADQFPAQTICGHVLACGVVVIDILSVAIRNAHVAFADIRRVVEIGRFHGFPLFQEHAPLSALAGDADHLPLWSN